jgi:hypothetical protein
MLNIIKTILLIEIETGKEPIVRFLNNHHLKSLVIVYLFIKIELIGVSLILPVLSFLDWIL